MTASPSHLSAFSAALALMLSPVAVSAQGAVPAPSPGEIVAAARPGEWRAIAASDLLVMTLSPDQAGRERRVVIQLMPAPFSQGWVENIRRLARARFWDGLSINRVQDNYVVQWGDANAEHPALARPLPGDLQSLPATAYATRLDEIKSLLSMDFLSQGHDAYAAGNTAFREGWPVGLGQMLDGEEDLAWPIHCYGMVGVGRDMPPDTGSGAELYAVIGHSPRHLDRNIAVVGRVIAGIEHLSTLPRGTLPLGFYERSEQRVPIISIRLGSESPASETPQFQYLDTNSGSFRRYALARVSRRDPFFIHPALGGDICNIPVPVRPAPGPANR